jgi:hypothetical protein
VCHVSLPSSYQSQRGHIHLPQVLPLVGCWSKTPTARESSGRQGRYIDKTGNCLALLPPPTTPLLQVRATQLRIGLRFGRKTIQTHTSLNYAGRKRGRLRCLFNFQLLFYMAEAPSSTSTLIANFIPHHLQLQPSSPSTSILVANFIPRRQLQPSSP